MSARAAAPRRRSPAVAAGVGAAAALLALSTLGLTWVRRTVEGPLGDAGAAQVEQLTGRDVAPLVAALVPGVTAVVVVGLLLRGGWRVAALVVAALGAGTAALSAGTTALGAPAEGAEVTGVPLVATLACLVVAVCAVTAAVGALRTPRSVAVGDRAPDSPAPASAAAPVAASAPSAAPGPEAPSAPSAPSAPPPEGSSADLWRALDEGRDPTGTA